MTEWTNNPVLWIGVLSAASVVLGAAIGFGRWSGKVDSDRNSFNAFMAEIRTEIKEVRDNTNKILGRLGSDTVAGTSPLRLTEKGQRISALLNAPALAREVVPRLEARVAGKRNRG